VQNQTSRKSIGARLCIRKQQSGANHSAEPTLIHINAALSIADDFLPDKTICLFVQPCALGVCLEHEDFIMLTHMPPVPPANRSKTDHGSDSGKEVSVCTALLVLPPYIPPVAHVLDLSPPTFAMWVMIFVMSLAPLIVTQAVTLILVRWNSRRSR
jgi:hypothetical protein